MMLKDLPRHILKQIRLPELLLLEQVEAVGHGHIIYEPAKAFGMWSMLVIRMIDQTHPIRLQLVELGWSPATFYDGIQRLFREVEP